VYGIASPGLPIWRLAIRIPTAPEPRQTRCVTSQPWWLDPESAWWAKADRAQQHIDALSAQAEDFLTRGSYAVVPEAGDRPSETVHRIQMSRPIPVSFSTILGDALHNLRSPLDCAVLGIAQQYLGRDLDETEEWACQFPIYGEPEKLDEFFANASRAHLFGASEQQAIRAVQPGWLYDYLAEAGRADLPDRSEEVRYDPLTLLQRLSNIDKHRRLHVVTCWPGLIYWGSDGPSQRAWLWGTPPFVDGAVLGYLIDDPEHPEQLPDLHQDMELRLLGPPAAANTEIVGLLSNMHRQVTSRVLPKVLNPV
jgi:hypothetical protein